MSANVSEEDRRDADEAGMDGSITKPIRVPALVSALSTRRLHNESISPEPADAPTESPILPQLRENAQDLGAWRAWRQQVPVYTAESALQRAPTAFVRTS